jgi:hypothetical protein
MNDQDFSRPIVDFTGINPVTGADHNNLVDLSIPTADIDDTVGKGLNLVTTDSALDTPSVPDASTTTKWKRYQWIRRPFTGATDKRAKAYSWNDDATNDATYLKWQQINSNTDEIDALSIQVSNAVATANDAVITADGAADMTNTAVANANTALLNSTNATNSANAAVVSANGAITTANNAIGIANAASLESASTVAEVDKLKQCATIIETQTLGTGAGNSVAGQNTRLFTTITQNAAFVAFGGDTSILEFQPGTYLFDIAIPCYNTPSVALVVNDSDSSVLLNGSLASPSGSLGDQGTVYSIIKGILTFAVITDIRIDQYCTSAKTNGLGLFIGAGFGITLETYSQMNVIRVA